METPYSTDAAEKEPNVRLARKVKEDVIVLWRSNVLLFANKWISYLKGRWRSEWNFKKSIVHRKFFFNRILLDVEWQRYGLETAMWTNSFAMTMQKFFAIQEDKRFTGQIEWCKECSEVDRTYIDDRSKYWQSYISLMHKVIHNLYALNR